MIDRARAWIETVVGLNLEHQQRIVASLVVIAILWLIRQLVLALVRRRTEDVRVLYRWRKSATYVAVTLGIFVVGRMWFQGFSSLATYLGLLSAGLAIALQDLVRSFAGWLFILWRQPFGLGDRIQIGEQRGDVIDLRLFQFSLMEIGNWVEADQSTGRVVHIPNGRVFTETLANYSRGFQHIWEEIPVLVTFESDWEKAKGILSEIARTQTEHLSQGAQDGIKKASQRFMIFYEKLTPIVYTSVVDSGVLLTLRFLCEPRRRRSSTEAVWEAILRAFADCPDIDFAYPTTRFYDNRGEGKPQARAESPPASV
jgi:small-conductance mechanosensitive channel